MSLGDDAPEIGRDALDPVDAPSVWAQLFPARRVALGLGASAAPSLAFVLTGVVLGPAVLDVLTITALGHLDVVVSIALAALGVFIGLGIGAAVRDGTAPLIGAGIVQASVTIGIVAVGLHVLLARWGIPLPLDATLFVAIAAICSCASAATRPRGASPAAAAATRVGDFDDVPLVLLGTFAVTVAAGRPVDRSVILTGVASLLAGAAGWLLFERARGDAERGVFVTGTVVLLGGIAAYASTSPLFSGCMAALFWHAASGAADRIIAADISKLQHPLVALLLVIAGASIEWSAPVLWLVVALVLLRLTGKLVGSAAAARITGVPAGLLGVVLVPPGVLGIALAVNVHQVLGSAGTLLLSAVTISAVASELLAALLPIDAERRT